jgi:glycerol kinase
LLYNLTGVHATDVTNASRTMLFDTPNLEWSDWLLSEFDVPAAMLPSVYPSSHPRAYGTTDEDGPLGAAVPVTALIGDQQGALFGHTAFDEGDVKHTIGSSSVLQMNVGTEFIESEHGLNTTVGYQIAGEAAKYALEGEIFIGGQAVEWLEEMGIIDSPSEIESLTRSVDSTEGAYFVPAFHGLATPYWDPSARGTIVGLNRGSGPEHLARATLEAIGYRTKEALDAMRSESGLEVETIRLDGGMSQNGFVCEFIANLTQSRIEIPEETETTSMGAAFAAGLAVDVWSDLDEIRAHRHVARRIDPSRPFAELEGRYKNWQRAVEWSREWDPEAGHGD